MPNNRKQNNNFLQAINKYAEEQRKQIQNEAEEFKKQEIAKAEDEILNDAYNLIQKEMAEMRNSIASEISKKEMESRRELFQKRQNITDEIFSKAKNKLIEFTKTDKYKKLLIKYTKEMSKVLNKDGTILYVKEEDLCFSEDIKKAFSNECAVQASKNITIGGIYGCNTQMGIVVDQTLDSKLDEQHTWFSENSGLKLI